MCNYKDEGDGASRQTDRLTDRQADIGRRLLSSCASFIPLSPSRELRKSCPFPSPPPSCLLAALKLSPGEYPVDLPKPSQVVSPPYKKSLRLEFGPAWLQAKRETAGEVGEARQLAGTPPARELEAGQSTSGPSPGCSGSPSSSPAHNTHGLALNPTPAAGDCAFKLLLSRGCISGGGGREGNIFIQSPSPISSKTLRGLESDCFPKRISFSTPAGRQAEALRSPRRARAGAGGVICVRITSRGIVLAP